MNATPIPGIMIKSISHNISNEIYLFPNSTFKFNITYLILNIEIPIYPPLFFQYNEYYSTLMCINPPYFMGIPKWEIIKTLNPIHMYNEQKTTINITFVNTGNIPIKNIIINEMYTFDSEILSISNGSLRKQKELLIPTESFSIIYTLKGMKIGKCDQNPSEISFLIGERYQLKIEGFKIIIWPNPYSFGIISICIVGGLYFFLKYYNINKHQGEEI
jgi:archaellum component FlaF (FlaF/FlaG flagellin family)